MVLLAAGCGNNFRPIAGPLPQPGGDISTAHEALVLSSSGPAPSSPAGTVIQIDVSGDTEVAQQPVGVDPVQAVIVGARTYVANRGDSTVTAYLTFGGPGTTLTTVSMTPASKPGCPGSMGAAAGTDNIYVALSGCGVNANAGVAVVSAAALTLTQIIPSAPGSKQGVSTDPESLAVLPDGLQVFVANKGSNDVTVINTADNTITVPNIAVGASPGAVTASSDSACVYVANEGASTVSVIETSFLGSTNNPLTDTLNIGAPPSFMAFDANTQRLYVGSTAGDTVSVFLHNKSCLPSLLKTVTVGSGPVGLAVLPDGSRYYVANQGDNTVTVVDAGGNTVTGTIALPANAAPVSIAASPDSTRVYVANGGMAAFADSHSVSIITTGNNSIVANMRAPAVPCSNCGIQSPTFILMTQ